jgi:hypothetical protein
VKRHALWQRILWRDVIGSRDPVAFQGHNEATAREEPTPWPPPDGSR